MIVSWTDRAKERLYAIRDHIAKDNPDVAKSTIEKILVRSAQLACPPDIGHIVEGYEKTKLKEVLLRPYRIIYRVNSERIDIISVLHYRQLLPRDLETKISELNINQ